MTERYEQTSRDPDGGHTAPPQRYLDADGDGVPDEKPAPVAADARQRAVRTFVQGLLVAVVLAVLAVLVQTIGQARSWGEVDWPMIGLLAVQAVLAAVASYVARYLTPPSD